MLAYILLAFGGAFSLLILYNNWRYWRAKSVEPQGAGARILPEAHILGAALGAAAAWVTWGWLTGLGMGLAWLVVAAILTRLMAEFA